MACLKPELVFFPFRRTGLIGNNTFKRCRHRPGYNYRAIAISNVETKILQAILMQKFNESSPCDLSIWILEGSLSQLCASAVTVEYYLCRGSYVFICFVLDFDKVSYW